MISLEEKKQQVISEIENLSEKELQQLWEFMKSLNTQKNYVDTHTFEKLVAEDSEKYQETYQKLA